MVESWLWGASGVVLLVSLEQARRLMAARARRLDHLETFGLHLDVKRLRAADARLDQVAPQVEKVCLITRNFGRRGPLKDHLVFVVDRQGVTHDVGVTRDLARARDDASWLAERLGRPLEDLG